VLAATLARSPLVVAGTNSITSVNTVGATKGPVRVCQGNEVLPAGTTTIRMWLASNVKPAVAVAVLAGSRTVASGTQVGGWLGKVTTIPVTRVSHALYGVKVCFSFDRAVQAVELLGGPSGNPALGEEPDKVLIEYLRPGPSPWWSLVGSVAQRIGMGRAPAGVLAAGTPPALMALATILVLLTISWQLAQGPRVPAARIAGAQTTLPTVGIYQDATPASAGAWRSKLESAPAMGLAFAFVAVLSAASWSIVTPPFQAPDEPAHFAYAQTLAENGTLPMSSAATYSQEESRTLLDLDQPRVRFNQAIGTISTEAQQRRLQADQALHLSRTGRGAGVATSEPPLYYALQTLPYLLGGGATLLERLELMRLLSALMAGFTAFFAFMFLREALPGVPWAWTVGALCTALTPLLGFISGIVNPDAMLCAISAALFYCLARGFRRGLTPRLAIAIGALTACGLLTKLNFVGLAPGVVLALVLLTRRAVRASGGNVAYRSLATAIAAAAIPSCLYLLLHRGSLDAVSTGISTTGTQHGSLLQGLSYIWQFYLPRLPGMTSYFPGLSTIRQMWFDKAVGMYGWLDTTFPNWVYDAALVPAMAIGALCARELARARRGLRARGGELGVYAAMGAGLLVLFGADSYTESAVYAGAFSEPRYLLPLAALFAAILALAARGAGRRWGPAVGALIVMLILAHDIFSQLLVVGRYYG
jgi:hypothetical protein